MAIVVLFLWAATAAAGITLLRAGGAARRLAAQAAAAKVGLPAPAVVRIGAIPLTEDGKPPPGPHVRIVTPQGEHPLLEFSHPTLAVTGMAFWLMFTFVHYRPFAWIALGCVLVTICIGLGWLATTHRRGRRHAGAWRFPVRLIALHGLSASLTVILAVVATLVASRT
ncbi:MAG TPA: hypothetical protein VEL03_09350 [Streptosporangiaceae bacterium]|nr:hypothetical protein [Streptosporangiaceae bacterium]